MVYNYRDCAGDALLEVTFVWMFERTLFCCCCVFLFVTQIYQSLTPLMNSFCSFLPNRKRARERNKGKTMFVSPYSNVTFNSSALIIMFFFVCFFFQLSGFFSFKNRKQNWIKVYLWFICVMSFLSRIKNSERILRVRERKWNEV